MENLIQFNESEIDWKPAPGPDGEPLDHVSLSFLNVDENAKIAVSYSNSLLTKKYKCIDIALTIVLLLYKAS